MQHERLRNMSIAFSIVTCSRGAGQGAPEEPEDHHRKLKT